MEPSGKLDDELAAEIHSKTKNPHEWLRQAEYLNAAGNSVIESSNEAFKRTLLEPDTYKRFEKIGSPEHWMTFAGVMLYRFCP